MRWFIDILIFSGLSQMLKHVQISPLRNRSDSLSLRSNTSCSSSLCGSPEPTDDHQLPTRSPSRASSYSSLSDTIPQVSFFTSVHLQSFFPWEDVMRGSQCYQKILILSWVCLVASCDQGQQKNARGDESTQCHKQDASHNVFIP